MAAIVEIKNLSLAYGDYTALADMSLQLEEGEFVAVVGASGVGKSTLLRILAGLAKPTAGSVITRFRTDPAHRPTALMFQDARLLPWRRAIGNVLFALEGLGLPKAERLAKANAALRLVGLADYARRWPYQLSGGQRQRVALARALTVQPELLLLDEPFGALDAMTRASLQDELLRVWQSTGCSLLFVTHDLDEAVYLADRVVLLGGSPAQVVYDIKIPEPRPRLRGALKSVSSIREELQRTVTAGSDI